jgi:predicted SprT family Zn-dependent metalloprotease
LECQSAPDYELQKEAENLLAQLKAEHPLKSPAKLIWRNYRVAAGKAYLEMGTIGVSKILLVDSERLRSTLLHEYAHLMAFERSPRNGRGHGPIWQKAMRELGEEPTVRHKYDVERNQARQLVLYRCVGCGAELPRKRRLPKRRAYVHATCGAPIKFVGFQAAEPLE